MDKALDEKLCKDFPLTFRDRYASMKETGMCWGFECGVGWEPIIREAASKLEPLIQDWIDNNPVKCACGCQPEDHTEDGCQTIHELPYMWGSLYFSYTVKDKWTRKVMWRRFKRWVQVRANRVASFLFDKFHVHKKRQCFCKKFKHDHPCATQIKEKYAGLRFYINYGTDEMHNITDAAENKSEAVCEECGAPGETCTSGYWIKTMCSKCIKSDWAKERGYMTSAEAKKLNI